MSLQLPERLNITNANAILVAGREAIDGGLRSLDLSGLQRVDSAAVAVLLGLARHARQHAFTLEFKHIPNNLKSLITLYGLDEVLATVSISTDSASH